MFWAPSAGSYPRAPAQACKGLGFRKAHDRALRALREAEGYVSEAFTQFLGFYQRFSAWSLRAIYGFGALSFGCFPPRSWVQAQGFVTWGVSEIRGP